jgi:hypothetical protein
MRNSLIIVGAAMVATATIAAAQNPPSLPGGDQTPVPLQPLVSPTVLSTGAYPWAFRPNPPTPTTPADPNGIAPAVDPNSAAELSALADSASVGTACVANCPPAPNAASTVPAAIESHRLVVCAPADQKSDLAKVQTQDALQAPKQCAELPKPCGEDCK